MSWSIAGVVRHGAARRPEHVAITADARAITNAELDRRSSRVAQALLAAGAVPGDRVTIIAKNSPEQLELLFGLGKLGAVPVPVNWRLAPAEMLHVVTDAGARIVVADDEFTGHVREIEPRLAAGTTIVTIGGDTYTDYERWIGAHEPIDPMTPVADGDVAMQIYTSGTTGAPKGVLLTNANFAAVVENVATFWDLHPEAVTVVCLPFFHVGGAGYALVALHFGARLLLFREFRPEPVLQAMAEHRATNAVFVPAMLHALCASPAAAELDFSALRTLIYGSSPISPDVLRVALATFDCRFVQSYGLTEVTGGVTHLGPQDHTTDGPRAGLLRSAGKVLPWIEIRVVRLIGDDPATATDVAQGVVGEVWIRSAQNMLGYWHLPEQTAAALTPDGWFRSGDAGYLDPEGFLFLTDRIKDIIVSGAENISPAEVEVVLAQHPAVGEVAVIGVPHPRWHETVKAVVVPTPGAQVDAADLIAFAKARLAGFKCPTSVDVVEALPRNPTGKVLKRELRRHFWEPVDAR